MTEELGTQGQQVHRNPGQGLPNADEQIRLILWQQSVMELLYEHTKVLIEIRDILKEEQITVKEMLGASDV